MEALELLRKYKRMCNSVECCAACPLSQTSYDSACDFAYMAKYEPETLVHRIETWSKEHPIITNARKFKEVFGLPAHCMIDQDAQWWDEPYKEPEVGQ